MLSFLKTAHSGLFFETNSTPLNPVIYVTSLTSNLTAPFAHLNVLPYAVHIYLPLKYPTALSNKLPIPCGIVYLRPCQLLLALHKTSWKTIIPPLYHSHSPKLYFAFNLKLTVFAISYPTQPSNRCLGGLTTFLYSQAMAMLTISERRRREYNKLIFYL